MQYHSSLALVIASATTGQHPTSNSRERIIAVLVMVFEPYLRHVWLCIASAKSKKVVWKGSLKDT